MINNRAIPIGLLFFLSLWMHVPVRGQDVPQEGLDSITPEEMKAHVYYLASDAMKGRNTPSPELDTCASFIARQFASYGLEPPSPEQSYFQPFYVLRARLAEANSLELKTPEEDKVYEIKNDFVPLHLTANRKVSAPVVFAGYGITAPEYDYDDYSRIDAKGKIVLVFTGEPQQDDSTSQFEGLKRTEHSNIRVKIENAVDHGAVGLLLISDPHRRFRRPPNPWPSLMRRAPEDAVPLTIDEKPDKKIVCIRLGRVPAQDLMAGSGHSLQELFDKINGNLESQSFDIQSKSVTMETSLEAERFPTKNVMGYWEGSDPELKDELVIIGAHYDHVGVQNDSVYNGADDNASGTAGVLEIAQAFAQCQIRPKRSILFITFTGEEKGLFGSRYYSQNPLYPVENTVAMLNMDMISRNDTNEVAIIGTPTSPDLKEIGETANKRIGLILAYDQERYFLQSDHYPFYRKDIPVLCYNSKDTPDLHRPTDDPEKSIPEKMARIGKLVFATAWMIADRYERPNFVRVR